MSEVVTAFGEKSVSAQHVAQAVAHEVRGYRDGSGALGPHLADQWMLPLALAVAQRRGQASFTCTEMTGHATTNIGTIEKFLPLRFAVEGAAGCWRVTVAARI